MSYVTCTGRGLVLNVSYVSCTGRGLVLNVHYVSCTGRGLVLNMSYVTCTGRGLVLNVSYVTCTRRGLLEACACFFQASPHAPFPFADFALHPFPVIILSHECDHILSPVSTFIYYSIHQTWRKSWGPLAQSYLHK